MLDLREIDGTAERERNAQRQANKERVIVEAIGLGEKYSQPPDKIRKSMQGDIESWSQVEGIDWLNISTYDEWAEVTDREWLSCYDSHHDNDPAGWEWWEPIVEALGPSDPFVNTLVEWYMCLGDYQDVRCEDVAALPATAGNWQEDALGEGLEWYWLYPRSYHGDGIFEDDYEYEEARWWEWWTEKTVSGEVPFDDHADSWWYWYDDDGNYIPDLILDEKVQRYEQDRIEDYKVYETADAC